MLDTLVPGRTVHYELTKGDCERIRVQRGSPHGDIQGRHGNPPDVGQVVPLVVVRVWNSTLVNGQLLLDGNDSLWVTSVQMGTGPGFWRYSEALDAVPSPR